jgi:hydroxymethylglutaryl-CoA synthase
MPRSRSVAVLGVGVGVPAWRLSAADIAAAWGGRGGRGAVAVCGPDEDTLTLAWTACDALLAETALSPDDVDGLWWGTTRPPFAEGPSWSHLAATLRLGPGTAGAVNAGSPHAGVEALLAAADAVAAGTVERALVVTSDALLPGTGTTLEPACGAAATAVLLGPDPGDAPAVLGDSASRWIAAIDRYRGDREDTTRDVYDGRLFREEVFLPLSADTAGALATEGGTRWSLPDPDGRLGGALARKLGTDQVASAAVRKALGDTGAAAALTGLVPALTTPGPAALLAFGGGRSTAVAIDVRTPVPGAERAAAALGADRVDASYAQVLRARGQLEAAGEHVEMAVPPGSAMFVRGNAEILGLVGGRCVECATVSFPPAIHPACLACGGGKFDPVPLARTGTVQTFVVNHAMPAPFVAPLPLVCVDLDDGTRVMFQGDGTGAELEIGGPVDLVLRRYAIERGVPVYGWKVRSR